MSIRILGIQSGPFNASIIPPKGWHWRVVRREGESLWKLRLVTK